VKKIRLSEFKYRQVLKQAFSNYKKQFLFTKELNEQREIVIHQSFWDNVAEFPLEKKALCQSMSKP